MSLNINDMMDSVIQRASNIQALIGNPSRNTSFKSYAVSNFRGGIGKSTLCFNLAYELSKLHQTLLLDLCPQTNLSQSILGEDLSNYSINIYDALISELTGTGSIDYDTLIERAAVGNKSFIGNNLKKSFIIPGSQELFLFPSLLYSQLAQYQQLSGKHGIAPSERVLRAIHTILNHATSKINADKVLVDTSPFFGGATHLAWCSVDALIIPVRVDQNSIEALRLTLDMLGNSKSEFHKFNNQAGIDNIPKVHAIAMTHCGWSRQTKNKPDSSTRFFLQKALEVSKPYAHLFSDSSIENCFYLLDDFLSSGRISGKQRVPLAKLEAGQKFSIDGQRLEVNPSINRYKREMKYISDAL